MTQKNDSFVQSPTPGDMRPKILTLMIVSLKLEGKQLYRKI